MYPALFTAPGKRPRARLMMAAHGNVAVPYVALSVDAGRIHSTHRCDAREDLHQVAARLQALLDDLHLAATWGVGELLMSPLVEGLRAAPEPTARHEVAVRLDPDWSSPLSRRRLLADGLARLARQADTTGLEITTLFAERTFLEGNYDLLVKRGITSVRTLPRCARAAGGMPAAPWPLRYGLWEYPVTHALPSERPWNPRRLVGIRPGRSRAAGNSPCVVVHLAIDAGRLAPSAAREWRGVEKSLRALARLQSNGGIRVQPLRPLTARLAKVPAAAPQRSILRRAA